MFLSFVILQGYWIIIEEVEEAFNFTGNTEFIFSDNIKIIPNDREYLSSLPGVGRKTINVFLSVIYNEPLVAVDTHVNRVSKRLDLADEDDNVLEVENKLNYLFPKDSLSKIHHQLVFFGRYKCKSINPLCDDCKLKDICKYYSMHSKSK